MADFAIDLGNIEDADIYTFHAYEGISYLEKDIQDFQEKIGKPYGKLLLVEEFNPGAYFRHTPNYQEEGMPFEEIMEVCRRNGVPWMFWEHGYQFDEDDIWHANTAAISDIVTKEEPLDGVFWGAKVLPGAKRIWQTDWDWTGVGKRWNVHNAVSGICSEPQAACYVPRTLYFIDTFSEPGPLGSEYKVVDDDNQDQYFIDGGNDFYGHLRIQAAKRQDLWGGNPPKTGAPLVLHDVPGGYYSVETFVSAGPLVEYGTKPSQPLNTQMGLIVFQDPGNWTFFGLTNHDFTEGNNHIQGDGLTITSTVNGKSSVVTLEKYEEDYAFLKIEHRGDGYWRFSWKRENGEP